VPPAARITRKIVLGALVAALHLDLVAQLLGLARFLS
jgi:hypothetical protein